MKKAVLILLILCLLCSAVGCGSSSGGSSGSVLFPPEPKGDTPSETRWDESAEMPAAEEETSIEPVGEEPLIEQVYGNSRSVQLRSAVSGDGATGNGYSFLIQQDDMLYFSSPGHDWNNSMGDICSIPLGGSRGDVNILLSTAPGELSGLVEIQVVGPWIYLLQHPTERSTFRNMNLSRLSLDGYEMQQLRSDIVSNGFNTVIIRDSDLFCTVQRSKQVSASHYQNDCVLLRVDLNSGSEEELFTLSDSTDFRILAYNEDKAILKGNDSLMMLDLDEETVSPAPAGIAYFAGYSDSAGGFMPGTDGSFWYYWRGVGELYRFLPETGYAQELYVTLAVTQYAYESPSASNVCQFLFLDLDHFITNCAGNIREKRALWLVEYGQRGMIVGDYGGNLTLLEDGYLYYTYNGNGRQSPGGDHLCRILLDGSGWESLNW